MTACLLSSELGVERAKQSNDLVQALNHGIRGGNSGGRIPGRAFHSNRRLGLTACDSLPLWCWDERVVFHAPFPDGQKPQSLERRERLGDRVAAGMLEELRVAHVREPSATGDLPLV